MPYFSSRLALAAFLGAFACEGKSGSAGPPAAETGGAEVADPEACAAYSKKVCEHAGESTPSCESIKRAVALLSPATCAAALADVDFSLRKLDDLGKTCRDLADKLCGDLGSSTQTCQMVRGQTPSMPPEQCESMMGQYDQVLAELRQMEARNQPLAADKAAKLAAGSPPAFGPEDAAVTIVEFSDFQCPYCSVAAGTVGQIKEKYGDRARFVFRQFPLPMHPDAHIAAQASLAAHEQGKFWAFHDLLFANQRALDRQSLEKYAAEAGLDVPRFKRALDKGQFSAAVADDMALGKDAVVDGTPTMFVNGVRVARPTEFGSIAEAIDSALAAAG